jgi:hypothetical protein
VGRRRSDPSGTRPAPRRGPDGRRDTGHEPRCGPAWRSGAAVILLVWRAEISPARAEEYQRFERERCLRMFRLQPGFVGVLFLRRTEDRVVSPVSSSVICAFAVGPPFVASPQRPLHSLHRVVEHDRPAGHLVAALSRGGRPTARRPASGPPAGPSVEAKFLADGHVRLGREQPREPHYLASYRRPHYTHTPGGFWRDLLWAT